MNQADQSKLYVKGEDRNLDKKLREYRKLRIWAGKAWRKTLDESETDILLALWIKERRTPYKMSLNEVATLLARLSIFLSEDFDPYFDLL